MKEALAKYLAAIKADYADWQKVRNEPITKLERQIREKMEKEFNDTLVVVPGKKYFKIMTGTSVHSFIVLEDGDKFKRGDILKAASWQQPSKNQARGNIFGEYRILWTGTEYLK